MKTLFLFLLSLVFIPKGFSQHNTPYVDSILNLIAKDQITIFDVNQQPLDNIKIWEELIQVDTIVNCLWSRPKVIDNIHYGAFDGTLGKYEHIFDTATYLKNPQFIVFSREVYDPYIDDFVGVKNVFLLNRTAISKTKIKRLQTTKKFFTQKNQYWINHQIKWEGKIITFDSCHTQYRLKLHKDFTFQQYYGNHQDKCATTDMQEEIKTGVEDDLDRFMTYKSKFQGHYVENSTGSWIVKNGKLILKGEIDIVVYEILEIGKEKLILKLEGMDYEVILIKKG